MFWIYGGALHFGNAGIHFYDGSNFAAYEDVVVVSANYRTNVFGFPASPEIPLEKRNLGFLDQRLALDWVQRNIAAFGGSPDKVTIFGESAGAWSIDALLTSFPAGSKPPFRAAILQSGQISYKYLPQKSSVPSWKKLVAALDCPGSHKSDLACVSAANATEIRKIISEGIIEFNPVADNKTLMSFPAAQRLKGDIAFIPVLGGTLAQEGRVFALTTTNASEFLLAQKTVDASVIRNLVTNIYPLNSPLVGSTDYDQAGQILTEMVFQCSQARWANDTAAIGIPTWRYYYNATFPNTQPWANLGVFHSSEIPVVFGTYSVSNATTQEYALSQFIMGAWAKFAKNPLGGPGWNPVGTGSPGWMIAGDYGMATAGFLVAENSSMNEGSYSLGVLGNRGENMGSGVTVIDQNEVDFRCHAFSSVYEMFNSPPP
jgi:acetylcholinesterase